MNRPIYLNEISYKILPNRDVHKKSHRARYWQYLRDLYQLYNIKLTAKTLYEGGQYSYAELGESLLDPLNQQKKLLSLDMIVIAHWSEEFDPDYAACGPYFLQKYQLNSQLFDLCDQGILAPYMALKILLAYQQNEQNSNGMVLCLEQTTVPRNKSHANILPSKNGALAIFISSNRKPNSYVIKSIKIISASEIIKNIKNYFEFVIKNLNFNNLLTTETVFFLKKNTLLWRIICYENKLSKLNFCFIESKACIFNSFQKLAVNLKNKINKPNILIFEEDVESCQLACVWLKKDEY